MLLASDLSRSRSNSQYCLQLLIVTFRGFLFQGRRFESLGSLGHGFGVEGVIDFGKVWVWDWIWIFVWDRGVCRGWVAIWL